MFMPMDLCSSQRLSGKFVFAGDSGTVLRASHRGLSCRAIVSISTSHPRLQGHCGRGTGKMWVLTSEVESWEMMICCHNMADEHISSQQQWLSGRMDGPRIRWWSYEQLTAEGGGVSLLWGCGCGYVVPLPHCRWLHTCYYMSSISWSQGFMNNNNEDMNLGRTWVWGRKVGVAGYDQNTLYKCMKISKNK